jgi:PPOX class probable F420-dependent enzyme
VEISEAVEFVRHNHRGVLAVTRSDGRTQMSPVTGTVDGDGLVVVSSRETAYKVRSLRARPYAAYCGFTGQFIGAPWVQVEGAARIISLPDAMAPLVEYYRSISGEHPDWDEYRTAMRDQGKSLIRVTIDTWGPIATGGFPPDRAPA